MSRVGPDAFDQAVRGHRRLVVVVTFVAPAEHLHIKTVPRREVRAGRCRLKRMTGRAQTDDRFARGHMGAQQIHHRFGRRASADAHDDQIRVANRLVVLEIRIAVLGRGRHGRHLITAPLEFLSGKLRQCFPSRILVLANDQRDPFLDVALEPERFAAQEIHAGDAGTPVLLDVFHDQLRAAKVRHVGTHPMVVHRVGQVPNQQDVLSLGDHLPDGEGAAEHAHVDVHAHDDDIGDAALAHEIERLGGIGNGIAVHDFQGGMLPLPRAIPGAFRATVAAAVRVIDGQRRFLDAIERAPALQGNFRFGLGRGLGEPAAGMILVESQGVAGTVNDEHPLCAGGFQHLVHPGRHFAHALGRIRAMMFIPHVADHHSGPGGIPLHLLLDDLDLVRVVCGSHAGPRMEGHRFGGQGRDRSRQEDRGRSDHSSRTNGAGQYDHQHKGVHKWVTRIAFISFASPRWRSEE